MRRTIITGTGSYIPPQNIGNKHFEGRSFFDEISKPITLEANIVAEKLRAITGIEERRYASDEHTTSELAVEAARLAIEDAGIDAETLDQILVAHNFGDVVQGTIQTDAVPSLASRVKNKLGIKNPNCIAFDLLFGCPGWVQGVINAHAFMQAGMMKRCLVIGAETLSRVVDIHDRDSMIFSDGAGAVVLEAEESNSNRGILSTAAQSHCNDEAYYIYLGKSYNPDNDPKVRYIKMKGRKVYEYAVKQVPLAIKECVDRSGVPLEEIKKIFIHQANEKMDGAIIKGFYKLYDQPMPDLVMPMNIQKLGNSSVATIPTLFDMVLKGELSEHNLSEGDVVVMASVGAGMNINAVCYGCDRFVWHDFPFTFYMLKGLKSRVQKKWAQAGLLSAEMILATVSFFASVIVFVTVAKAIFFDKKKQFDEDVFNAIKPMISKSMTSVMQFFTFFAKHDFLIPANLLLIAYFLFIKKHKWYSIKIPAIALSSTALLFLMKSYFNRNRPDPPLIEAAKGLSFPSGHAMMSFAFYGLLIYITHKLVKNKPVKIAIIIFLLLFIHLIGFSRIYLRVHYASDVIAGFAVGFIWLYFSLWVLNGLERKAKKNIAVTTEPASGSTTEKQADNSRNSAEKL